MHTNIALLKFQKFHASPAPPQKKSVFRGHGFCGVRSEFKFFLTAPLRQAGIHKISTHSFMCNCYCLKDCQARTCLGIVGGGGKGLPPPSKVYAIYFFWNRKRIFSEDKHLKEKKDQILEKYISCTYCSGG